jgi:hypothetical protein
MNCVRSSPLVDPNSICGTPISYDANGNTLSYDVDGRNGDASLKKRGRFPLFVFPRLPFSSRILRTPHSIHANCSPHVVSVGCHA